MDKNIKMAMHAIVINLYKVSLTLDITLLVFFSCRPNQKQIMNIESHF